MFWKKSKIVEKPIKENIYIQKHNIKRFYHLYDKYNESQLKIDKYNLWEFIKSTLHKEIAEVCDKHPTKKFVAYFNFDNITDPFIVMVESK
jgi:hypothetical protein